MKNRLYDCICVFVLLTILQSTICHHTKIVNDDRRTKREISVAETSQSKGDASCVKKVNLQHEERGDDDSEEDDTYQDNTKEKRKVSRKSEDSGDFPSNAEESFDRDDVSNYLNSRRSSEEPEGVNEEAREDDKNEEASNHVRLPRDIDSKYTDQDEKSSLYDDYEAKDVAKRGILSGPEDYEEIEDDSPEVSEDLVAVQESNEAEKREIRKDARVKRDQAEISEMFDRSKSSLNDPAKLEEPKAAAKSPYSREVSSVELLNNFNEPAASNDMSKIKGSESKNVISKLSDSFKSQEPTNEVISSKENEPNAEYEKHVEEEIQRKIDSLKEEIQRDLEIQQRIKDIEDNNARFDELRDQEHEDEERPNFKDESIEKRQTLAKRSIREITDDTAGSSNRRNEKERSLKRELHKKRQYRSNEIENSNTLRENKSLKRQFVVNHDKSSEQIPSKGFFKKNREHTRQIFLVNNDQAKNRQLRSYTLSSDRTLVGPENELFMKPDMNSHLYPMDKVLQVSLPVGSQDENNEGEQNPTAEHSNSLVSLTGSSQELSPRLEKEYKEAFGGLQNEPGSALARFKRIKRVLPRLNRKI